MKTYRSILCLLVAVVGLFAISQNSFGQAPSKQETICINGKCYPVISREIVSEPSTVETLSIDASAFRSDSRQFKRAFLEAARQARRSGEISAGQHLAAIAIAQRPAKLEAMKVSVHELAVEDGVATVTAIDWMKLIEFILKILPELISIFK
jgi:hypothetical protein